MLKRLTPNLRFSLSLMDLNRPPAQMRTPMAPVNFVEVPNRPYKLRHEKPNPVLGNPNFCPVEAGTHTSPERNFHWLPWLPGKVSYVHVTPGMPIVTGLMTGCWLVLFTLQGNTCFGHIGTEASENTPNSLDAKNAWKIAANARKITPLSAFNPTQYGPAGDCTFGALSANGHFYSIKAARDGNTYRVVGTSRVDGAPAVPRFL